MDAIIILLSLLVFVGAFALAKLWWWVFFWGGLVVWLAVLELLAVRSGRLTLTKRFRAYRQTYPITGTVLLILIAVGAAGLIIHLR